MGRVGFFIRRTKLSIAEDIVAMIIPPVECPNIVANMTSTDTSNVASVNRLCSIFQYTITRLNPATIAMRKYST